MDEINFNSIFYEAKYNHNIIMSTYTQCKILLMRYFTLFFSYVKSSMSSVYRALTTHLNSRAKFSLEIFNLCLKFIKFTVKILKK